MDSRFISYTSIQKLHYTKMMSAYSAFNSGEMAIIIYGSAKVWLVCVATAH